MYGYGGYGGYGGYSAYGFVGLHAGWQDPLDAPWLLTGQHDSIIVLDIANHAYIEGCFHKQIEKMAANEKLVRKHGTGFYNYSGSTPELIAIGAWPSERHAGPSSYPGGEVVSSWKATAWVLGKGGRWFQPLTTPKHTPPTWLQI